MVCVGLCRKPECWFSHDAAQIDRLKRERNVNQAYNCILFAPCLCISFCTVSPSACLDDIYLGLGSRVATFLERAAHSVNRIFSL